MRAPLKISLGVPPLLTAGPVRAVETSFHTYNGFQETVDAFQTVALIFHDPRYATLTVIIASVGIALGAVLASVRGSGMGLVAFGFQILIGMGLFVGLIANTGTVHVYDRVKNAYQAVGGVPVLIVIVAGTTNLIERAMVETIDDNIVDPNSKFVFGAGGEPLSLFLNAVSPQGSMTDLYLDATIKDYVRQCYPVARVSPAYRVDDDLLYRSTQDLPSAFAAMAGPSTFSTIYTPADKAGSTRSCEEAWSHISDRLSSPDLLDAYMRKVCQQTGFNVGEAQQLSRCREQLGSLGSIAMGVPMSGQGLMTHILLARTVGDVLFEDSPAAAARVMANRAVLSNGLAVLSTANEWLPTIRATVFGIMLFMVPIALLFILTPINLRVASFTLGLFVFFALWGVIDAGIHQLTLGRAMAAMRGLQPNAAGVNNWLLAPSTTIKALAVFGSFRTAAVGLAGAFVFTVFRFSGNVFTAFTGSALNVLGQGSAAAAPMATSEGLASALETQASAAGTWARAAASNAFGDFGERSNFGTNRSFGEASRFLGERPAVGGDTAFALGGIDAARQMGGLVPALEGQDLADPKVARAVQASAATGAIHQFAEKDALRHLGMRYFGAGEAGERAFAAFSQNLVQWRAFGDSRAYGMIMQGAQRHFERSGYSPADAALKASGVIAQAQSDPMFAKLIANSYDQEQLLRNDLTAAQAQSGEMAGRRDVAGGDVAGLARANVATEQALRTGANMGQRDAAAMLGLSLQETSRRIAFINSLSGEARSSAITQLAHATGRNEGQVLKAVEGYDAATRVGTADGASREARREGTSIYARTEEATAFDFAERSGKLDAQREVGPSGTRAAARIGQERQQADNFGFAAGAAAAGSSTREAAQLDAFIQALRRTAGNQLDMAEGGPTGIADRARNERLTRIVETERLSRMQGLLRSQGISMSKRALALAQNGDLGINLNAHQAAQMHRAGLLNDSQYGAIAQGGHARLTFADNDLLVSSTASFSQSARNDSSTRFEAGKQAGPDTIEHFLGGGEQGRVAMASWLQGGFEMDRSGNWRLKPQVADTLQRDVGAIISQTGWERSLARSANHQISIGTEAGADLGAVHRATGGSRADKAERSAASGHVGYRLSGSSSDIGVSSTGASASIDIVNYDVREAISRAERQASRATDPAHAFAAALSSQILGPRGLRDRYLGQAHSGRSVDDVLAPLTSFEQNMVLSRGHFSGGLDRSPFDGGPAFKKR